MRLPSIDTERLSFVEIRDRESWNVITVIELLSPANKNPGPEREQYLGKRGQILQSSTHLVEIDLLRGGPRMPMEGSTPCEYCILVSRWQDRPRAGIWPFSLRDPMPTIPIPLSEGHADIGLDLQSLLHRVYEGARYESYIYRGEPEPRLSANDQVWAKQFA